jgi:hypothetical protein
MTEPCLKPHFGLKMRPVHNLGPTIAYYRLTCLAGKGRVTFAKCPMTRAGVRFWFFSIMLKQLTRSNNDVTFARPNFRFSCIRSLSH